MNLSLKEYKKIRTPFVFLDETGSINDKINRYFALGMIKCMQPYFLDSKIRKIRQLKGFFDEIKWNTLSKRKTKIIEEIISAVFTTPGIDFSCIVIDKNGVNFAKEFNDNPYKAYEEFTKALLLDNIENNEVLTILADYVTVPHNVKFEVDIKHEINDKLGRLAVGGVHRVDSKGVNLIQIVDLLLGAVIYDYKIQNKLVTGDINKINILKYISKKLGIKTFTGGSVLKRFKVFEYKK